MLNFALVVQIISTIQMSTAIWSCWNIGVISDANLCLPVRQAVGKKLLRGLDLQYKRLSFFPYWRSALSLGFPVKVYPSYSYGDKHHHDLEPFMFKSESRDNRSYPAPTHDIGLLASMRQPTSNYQLKRQFGTAAMLNNYQPKRLFGTAALALLKVLKKAWMESYAMSSNFYRSIYK